MAPDLLRLECPGPPTAHCRVSSTGGGSGVPLIIVSAHPAHVPLSDLHGLMRRQDGVVARFQVLACGFDDSLIRSRVRRREWARLLRGVYVDHTGPPTWRQRAWAAVLYYWPAALSDESALIAHGLRPEDPPGHPRDSRPIQVAVDQARRVARAPGVRFRRVVGLDELVNHNLSPPRLRLEEAVVAVAAREIREDAAIACLADACQSRRTTPGRLVEALRRHPRLNHRKFLLHVLEDVANGAYSALEHRYLTRVERPHGLPTGGRQRQVRQGRSPAYRDVEYTAIGLVVELDGRLGHELALDRWDDFDRDIASLVAGDTTVRAGWGQVLDPCRLALAVARLMQALGWRGRPHPCGPGCPLEQRGRAT